MVNAPESPPPLMATRAFILIAALFAILCVLVVGHRNSSGLLIALFVLWVFAPFAVLASLVRAGSGWARGRQRVLQGLSAAVCAASVCAYGIAAFGVTASRPAFWFLVTPLASLCAIGIVHLVVLRGGHA